MINMRMYKEHLRFKLTIITLQTNCCLVDLTFAQTNAFSVKYAYVLHYFTMGFDT